MAAILLLLLLPRSSWATDYCADGNCQGCWLFTEGSGDVADSSTNTNTGTFKGVGEPAWESMAGTNAPSYADYMVHFDGSDDFINWGSDASLDNDGQSPLSIVFWAHPDTTASGDRPIGKAALGGTGYWGVRQDSGSSGRLDFFKDWSSGDVLTTFNNESFADGEWQHMVFTWTGGDNSGGTDVVLWRNGTEFGIGSTTQGGTARSDAALDLTVGTNYDGKMTEIAFFDDVLTEVEANDIMDNGLQPAEAPAAARRIMMIM